jgi:hypothetical protein
MPTSGDEAARYGAPKFVAILDVGHPPKMGHPDVRLSRDLGHPTGSTRNGI